jgi:predicted enzyme related to lactoylglutathione lyase
MPPSTTDSAVATPTVVGVSVYARDTNKAVSFWEQFAGIELERQAHDDGRVHFVSKLADGIHFEVKATHVAGAATPDDIDATAFEVSLKVADADEAIARAIALGARITRPAADYSWGRYGVVVDPVGTRIGLFSPTKESTES